MQIQEIKSQLTLSQVLHYYHLKPDKNLRLLCPFHDDKTPSLQVYYKTHTAYCFSTNCDTNGGSLDVIDFIMYMEKCTKHEAILKAKSMLNGTSTISKGMDQLTRSAVLTKMFTYFKNGVHNSKPAREYLQKRCLDFTKTEIGYNSGQFHHGTRKDKALIESCLKYGILLDMGVKSRTGDPAYKPFGKWCIAFPLRNCHGQIISLYFRSIKDVQGQKHYYLKHRQGLYPRYPKPSTKKLILTESIIDAASLEAQAGIKNKHEILSLFGTNGLTEEHTEAVSQLNELEEIIFFLNGDQAGTKAVQKYAPMLKTSYPQIKITNVEVPDDEDVNSLLQGHSPEILQHLIETRKEYEYVPSGSQVLFSNGEAAKRTDNLQARNPLEVEPSILEKPSKPISLGLDASNPYNLRYNSSTAKYEIKGFRVSQPDSLKITLQVTVQ